MRVDILKASGFCGGVIRALYLLDKTIKENPNKKIYVLGPIVHNDLVNKKYKEMNVEFISLMDAKRLSENDIIVISAHGTSNVDREALKGHIIIDTTCPYVAKNKMLIDQNDQNNIIFIGKKNHKETLAMTKDNKNIKIVETVDDLKIFSDKSFGEVFNQTTFNQDKLKTIHKLISDCAPYYHINNTTCRTSLELQDFLNKREENYNVCIIVGDKDSNNANSLFEMSPYYETHFIKSHLDVKKLVFREFDKIIIIGSASTPKEELKLVRQEIKNKSLIADRDI